MEGDIKTYTRDEVIFMLISVFMFSGANNNQGTAGIKGHTFGEKAETVLKVHEGTKATEKSMLSVVQMLKG